MTKQQYFDLLVSTSERGLFPAVGNFGCAYRTGTGRRCAVGLLIPDDQYRRNMEGFDAFNLFRTSPELQQFIPEGMTAMDLDRVQACHDRRSGDDWNHADFVAGLKGLPCFAGQEADHAAV